MSGVKPGRYDPMKPDIELFDFKSKKRFGLKLSGGSGSLQIGTVSQDDSVFLRSSNKRVGDFDEQRSWKSGRGIENLSSNAEGYWDSNNAWTLTSGHLHQTLLWRMSSGLRSCDCSLPDKTHSVSWKALYGTSMYVSISWSSSGFAADYARLWVRRVGTPETLTFRLHSDTAGSPGTVLQTVTVTTSDITDVVSVFKKFDWSGTETLSSSTTYHISVFGGANDNKNNHWEVGGYSGGSTGKISTDGSSWSADTFDMYYFVADADIARKWYTFFLDGAMYVVDSKDDKTTASKLYINGHRGKATASTSTTLTDSAVSWTTDRWVNAYVKIVRGTGAGQIRAITANTSTQLTVSVAWNTNPSTDSEFIIYGTRWFTELTTTGLGVVNSQPIVVNQVVYFPQGEATNIRQMVWNASTKAHAYSDNGTNKASFLHKAFNQNDGPQIWKANNNTGSGGTKTVARANAPAWAAAPAAMTFRTAINIGEATSEITGITDKDDVLYVFKEDGPWSVYADKPIKLQTGMEKTPDSANGAASIAHQQFLYYSWMHSVIRVYGSSHDDIGQDWSGYGLPDGREGVVSSFDAYTSLLMMAIDAGTGTSSVLGWDGLGTHEIFRAYDSNKRIRMVKVQPCPGTRNRTWIDVGGELVFQEMPYLKGSPRLDSGVRYMHEAVIESSSIDMGTASGLPKFIKEITVFCENLGQSNEVHVDYQVDDDVHTNNWTEATTLFQSPESTAFLGLNNVRKFAYRLRILSSDNTSPVDITGVTPNGYARSPYKMIWTLQCKADNITSRGRLVKPTELMRWLLDNARFPGRIEMKSQYELAHKFFVIIHPPRMFPYKPAANGMSEESVFTITLEEA